MNRIMLSSLLIHLILFGLSPIVRGQIQENQFPEKIWISPSRIIESTEVGSLAYSATQSGPFKLEQAIKQALHSNPKLLAAYSEFEAKLKEIPQVTSLPDPMFSYTQFVEEVQTRTGEQDFILGLSQKFPWFGKLALKGRLKDAEARMALEEYRAAMLNVIQQLSKTYHQLVFEYASWEVSREEQGYLRQFLDAASAAYAGGQSGRQSVLKAQTELARIENQLIDFPSRISTLEARLNRLMGAPADRSLPVPEYLPLAIVDLEKIDFYEQALLRRPELNRVEQMIQRSRDSYALARKDYWPDVTLGVNYIGIGHRLDDPAIVPSGEGDDAWNIAVMFNIPMPNARRSAQLEHAQKKEQAARYQQEALELEIQETLHSLETRLESLDEQLQIYEQSLLPLAQETFNTSQSEYLAGMGSFLDLLDSERTLLETRLSFLRLVRDYRLALADLERAVGVRVERGDRE